MRPNNQNRRGRGRGPRKPHGGPHHGGGGGQPSKAHSFDSSGPDIRVRGNAYQVLEKYLQLARDAGTAGDRVAAENFLQHADHYYRVVAAQNEGQLKVVGDEFSEERIGVGYSKDRPEMCEWINGVLEKAFDDGSWAEAFELTLGPSGVETPAPPELDACQ